MYLSMKLKPKLLKLILNIYPPYLFSGIRVTYVSSDWKELHVSLKRHWFNRNAVGTHFGGSLYSMVDPHLMLLLMQLLGKDYIVWDKAAEIEFVKATKKKVISVIKITNNDLELIKQNTADGKKYLSNFILQIKDENGNLISKVKKTIYIRKKEEWKLN